MGSELTIYMVLSIVEFIFVGKLVHKREKPTNVAECDEIVVYRGTLGSGKIR